MATKVCDTVSALCPSSGPLREVKVRHLGLCAYEPVWRAMQRFTEQRDASTEDELWLLEHEPIFTLGQAGKPEHLLMPGAIPVLRVDRGGQVTYHGPGQIVAYPLFDLRRMGVGVKELVCRIEQVVIDTCAHFGVVAKRRPGAPGVYVGEAKIAALGLRVRRGASLHGLAFNIDMDLRPFLGINPCGYSGLQVTQLLDCGGGGDKEQVATVLLDAFARGFAFQPRSAPAELPC